MCYIWKQVLVFLARQLNTTWTVSVIFSQENVKKIRMQYLFIKSDWTRSKFSLIKNGSLIPKYIVLGGQIYVCYSY